jgi:hypothetical protein
MSPKVKTAKNSKLPKLSEKCFEPIGKGGWPPISIWMNHEHKFYGHFPAKDQNLSGCQSRSNPAPRKVAHQGPNSIEIFSSHGGTQ